jgi:hypothetical protein
VTLKRRASSIASEDGPPMKTTAGIPATIAFCTISKLPRLLTARIASANGFSLARTNEPIVLSTALWRPTSSRKRSRLAARSNNAAPCTPPVALNAVCAFCNARGNS